MKTAISIPDSLFKTAEKTAKKMGVTRSNLYATAIKEFIENHTPLKVTEKLNSIYSSENSKLDDSIVNMQTKSINNGEW